MRSTHYDTETFLTAREAAPILQLHPRVLERKARAGQIPAYPLGDGPRKRWRFLRSELVSWMRSRVPCGIPAQTGDAL